MWRPEPNGSKASTEEFKLKPLGKIQWHFFMAEKLKLLPKNK
jgi:hypothetical protein